jgi:hypothetical protein
MKTARLVMLLSAVALAACVGVPAAPPERIEAPIIDVMRRSRNMNWLVRVHADSLYEGRVSFVRPDAARVGKHLVPFERVTVIERSYVGSDRKVGVGEGIALGFGLAYVLARLSPAFADPSGTILVIGAGVGAIVGAMMASRGDPSEREWTTIWQR